MTTLGSNRFTRHEKCGRCGWRYGFHICVDLTTPEPRSEMKQNMRTSLTKDEDKIAEWSYGRPKDQARNVAMLRRYAEGGIGYDQLTKEFNVAKTTVISVMKSASNAGLIILRPRGATIRKGAL